MKLNANGLVYSLNNQFLPIHGNKVLVLGHVSSQLATHLLVRTTGTKISAHTFVSNQPDPKTRTTGTKNRVNGSVINPQQFHMVQTFGILITVIINVFKKINPIIQTSGMKMLVYGNVIISS
jgi:hypothetical protein